MKFWFYLLLVLNLGLGGMAYLTHTKSVDANVVQELNPEKLPLVSMQSVNSQQDTPTSKNPLSIAPPASPVADITAATKAQPNPANENPAPPSAAPPAKKSQCLQWTNIKADDLPRARTALAALQLGDKLAETKNENILRYWVYIPAPETKKQLDAIVASLKKQGITDYSVLDDSTTSLGVFSTEEAATRHLEQMEIKGVRSARSGVRTTQLRDVMFTIRDPAAAVTSKLNT
ncbi:MAG: SPOR domain-containing protein, partial [Burkholderiales bacterium]